MIPIKTPQEIEIIKEAGKKLALVKQVVREHIKPGVTLAELDSFSDREIEKLGAEAAFKRVAGYNWATCINVGSGVVHGIPGNYKIKPGDKVSVDVGIYYKGFNVDSAFTVGVSPISRGLAQFLDAGQVALELAIKEAKPGNRIGHISRKIERVIKDAGYSPVFIFTGHGVGKELHEEPTIPCFLATNISDTPVIKPGMVLAIEAIYTDGNGEVVIAEDGWTAEARDGKIDTELRGGLFEETVAVTNHGPLTVTKDATEEYYL